LVKSHQCIQENLLQTQNYAREPTLALIFTSFRGKTQFEYAFKLRRDHFAFFNSNHMQPVH